MRALLTVALLEIRVTFRRRSFQIVTLLLPVGGLIAVLVLQIVGGREAPPEAERVAYVDEAGLFGGYRAQAGTEFVAFANRAEGLAALLREDVRRLYVIPQDYLASGRVDRYAVGQGFDFAGGRDPDPALRRFLLENLLGTGLGSEVTERVKEPLQLARITLDASGQPRTIDSGQFIFFQALAVLLVVSIFMSSGFLLQGVGEEKESRIMEVLLSSVTPGQLLIGKIAGLGAVGLAQITIWLVSGLLLLRLAATAVPDWPVSAPVGLSLLGVLFFVLGYLFFATLMAGLGAISATAREGQQISGIVVVPAIVPFYLTPYIVGHPTGLIVRLLGLFPPTAPVVVFQRLGISAIGPWEVLASATTLLIGVAAGMFLAVRVFRAYLLMYGKRPGCRELWHTLRRS